MSQLLRLQGHVLNSEIRAAGYCLSHRTFVTAHEAGRAYDTVAWRPVCLRWDLNFHDVNSTAEAKMLAPTLRLVTIEERQHHRQLSITEADERAMTAWRENFPQDVVGENEFYAQKWAKREAVRQAHKAVRRRKRERKALIKAQMEGPSTLDDIDPWWDDLFSLHHVEFVGLQLQNRRLDVLILITVS
jgi:hypothetical protein